MKKKQIISKLLALSLTCGVIASVPATNVFAATTTQTTSTSKNTVQQSVPVRNATAAVVKAEITKLKVNVDKAQVLINSLPSSSDKVELQTRLNVVQKYLTDLSTATTAVIKAEASKTQMDVNSAGILVNPLSNTNLNTRLDRVQDYINNVTSATSSVSVAENSKRAADVNIAQSNINILPAGSVKNNLQNKLNVVKTYISNVNVATTSVVRAERSASQADVDKAQNLVSQLPNGVDKTSLQHRIDVVKGAISSGTSANDAVTIAEQSKLQSDVDLAQALIDKLPSKNTNLQTRLNAVQKYISNVNAATEAVEKVEANDLAIDYIKLDIKDAQLLINVLPKDDVRTNLQGRIDVVQGYINDVTVAAKAVVKAEITNLQTNIDKAQELVNALPNGVDKTSLLERLNSITTGNGELSIAIDAVEKAEGSNLQSDVDAAQALLDKLSTPNTNLQTRVNVVQKHIDKLTIATEAVEVAEGSKIQADKDKAQTLVNAITSELFTTQKAQLQNRLDIVQQYINDTKSATYAETKDKILNPQQPANPTGTTTDNGTVNNVDNTSVQ